MYYNWYNHNNYNDITIVITKSTTFYMFYKLTCTDVVTFCNKGDISPFIERY